MRGCSGPKWLSALKSIQEEVEKGSPQQDEKEHRRQVRSLEDKLTNRHQRTEEVEEWMQDLEEKMKAMEKIRTALWEEAEEIAALNLASYHVRMNHKDEAMSAIKEAITMAQEASDHTCLQHVLSLLHRIVDNQVDY